MNFSSGHLPNVILLFILPAMLMFESCNQVNKYGKVPDTLLDYYDSANNVYRDDPAWILKNTGTVMQLIEANKLNDSLRMKWLTLKFNALVSLNQRDSAMSMLISEREKSIVAGNDYLLIYSDLYLGEHYLDEGKNKLAGKYIREGYIKAIHSTDEYFKAWAHNLMGSILRAEGDYKRSQFHLIKALELFEKQKVTHAVGAVCNNIALNYEATGDSAKTLVYLLKALNIAETVADTVNILASLNNLGIFYRTYKPDSAVFVFNHALQLTGNPSHLFQIITLKFNLGNCYLDRKDYLRARQIFEEVLNTCLQYQITAGVARSYNALAMIYDAENRNEIALAYYSKAYHLADSIGETPVSTAFLDNLRYIYEKTGNYKKALQLSVLYQVKRDSLLSLEKQVAVHDLELLYNTAKTELENQKLNSSVLLLQNRIRNNTIFLVIGLLIALISGIAAYFIFRLYQQRDAAYHTLFNQVRMGLELPGIPAGKADIHTTATPDTTKKLMDEIIQYFETEKPYLDSKLRLQDISRKFKINRSVLSQEIYNYSGDHFNTFINKYRVAEALRLLSLPEFNNFKIETIAMKAGFGSRTAFYEAFTQITGSKPSEYRKDL